jgi:molecular chaperone DnaK
MAAVKPPPAVPRPAAKAEEHPASNEMMTLSKAAYSISWDLPGAEAPPPASQPAPVLEPPPPPSSRKSIAELDVPDLDLTPAAGPTDIVAAPSADDDLELGLDIPSGPAGTQILAAPKVPPPPGFGGGTRIMAAPIVPPEQEVDLGFGASDVVPGPPEPEERLSFGQIDLAAAFAPERFAQGSAINTSANTPLLIDVTPLSLGVETVGGYADVLIPANSPVPCEKTRTFMTASDGQTSVTVRVAQGESPKFGGNTRLGDVELSGLRAARRGEVKISVTFELDADGILNVRARDPDTGRETVATMRLVGATNEISDLDEMIGRQARHYVQ